MAKKTHTVRKGDTLTAIAKANGTTVKKLLQANPNITDPNLIRVGQKIVIPDATAEQSENKDAKQMSVDTARNTASISDWRRGEEASMEKLANAAKSDVTIPGSNMGADTGNPGANVYGNNQDTFSMEQLAARFSIAASFLKSDLSLVKALNRILGMSEDGKTKIGPIVTDPNLQLAILKESDWFIKNSDDYRKYEFYKQTNPATYQADLQANTEAMLDKFGQFGITLDMATATDLAAKAMMKSANVKGNQVLYNNKYFNQLIANSVDFSKKRVLSNGKIVYDLGGKVEQIAESLYQTAWDFGYQATVSNSGFDKWLQNNVRGLIAGTVQPDDVDDELVNRARSMFPGLSDQLSRGQTLREAADPWVNALANEWEEDPRFMDLNDDFLYRVLNYQDEKGNIAPMNLYQAKTMARKSPKWQYTSRAKEEYTNIGQRILQDFGFLG